MGSIRRGVGRTAYQNSMRSGRKNSINAEKYLDFDMKFIIFVP
jgi:hypothetical protein